jgi:hypothetical protein
MSQGARRFVRAAQLMEAELGDELVALDPDGGQCFGFNPVAASIWKLLDEPRSAEDIEAELMELFEVDEAQCRAEVADLLADLKDRGLVREV